MNKREWMLQAALVMLGTRGQDWSVDYLSGLYDRLSPETTQEGAWVEHDGDVSKAPPENTAVDVQFRCGSTVGTNSDNVVWDFDGGPDDVLRWRYA